MLHAGQEPPCLQFATTVILSTLPTFKARSDTDNDNQHKLALVPSLLSALLKLDESFFTKTLRSWILVLGRAERLDKTDLLTGHQSDQCGITVLQTSLQTYKLVIR